MFHVWNAMLGGSAQAVVATAVCETTLVSDAHTVALYIKQLLEGHVDQHRPSGVALICCSRRAGLRRRDAKCPDGDRRQNRVAEPSKTLWARCRHSLPAQRRRNERAAGHISALPDPLGAGIRRHRRAHK